MKKKPGFFHTGKSTSSSSDDPPTEDGAGSGGGVGSGGAFGGGSDSGGLGGLGGSLGKSGYSHAVATGSTPKSENVPQDISIGDSEYTIVRFKTQGAYGKVYEGKVKKNNQKVIIKEIQFERNVFGISSDMLREASILKHLNHDNIVKLIDVIGEPDRIILVFDYFNWSLEDYMFTDNCNLETVKKLLFQILSGVQYCHAAGIIHRDIKIPNILVDLSDPKNPVAKLIDFGLSRVVAETGETHSADIGTLSYTAPEMLIGKLPYSYPSDIWSLGVTFAKMAGINIFPMLEGNNPRKQLDYIFSIFGTPSEDTWPEFSALDLKNIGNSPSQDLSEIFRKLGANGVDLLTKMLCLNPKHRITVDEALSHLYFQ